MRRACDARMVAMVVVVVAVVLLVVVMEVVVVVVVVVVVAMAALSPAYAVGQSSKGSLGWRQRPVVDPTRTGDMSSSVP